MYGKVVVSIVPANIWRIGNTQTIGQMGLLIGGPPV